MSNITTDTSFAYRLLMARKSKGLSLRDVQGATGINFVRLFRIEDGDPTARLSLHELFKLLTLYDLGLEVPDAESS